MNQKNNTALSPEELSFMVTHLTADVGGLLLRAGQPPGVDLKKVAAQLTARQKAQHKLPGWYADLSLIFPHSLSVEQASSEMAARYKASLVSGGVLIDATGGMGVDTQAFARHVDWVEYVEQNSLLAELAAYNLPLLGVNNVSVAHQNGLNFVRQYTRPINWLYLDPARRNERGGKLVQLADYEPDITRILPELLAKTERILLKTSPLIDIDQTMRQLGWVEAVHVVAVQHEVKEVLFVIGQTSLDLATIPISAVDLMADADSLSFTFTRADEQTAAVTLSEPALYVCEPNAAVLKAGAFRLVGTRFGLRKLAPNSHLYTADVKPDHFPGRVFAVQHIIRPDRAELKAVLPHLKANLTTRNFPQPVELLRKKLGLRDGGEVYILATTLLSGEKRLLITRKIA